MPTVASSKKRIGIRQVTRADGGELLVCYIVTLRRSSHFQGTPYSVDQLALGFHMPGPIGKILSYCGFIAQTIVVRAIHILSRIILTDNE